MSIQTLTQIADALDKAKREGQEYDDPEGTRYITMSDTLAKNIAEQLRFIGKNTVSTIKQIGDVEMRGPEWDSVELILSIKIPNIVTEIQAPAMLFIKHENERGKKFASTFDIEFFNTNKLYRDMAKFVNLNNSIINNTIFRSRGNNMGAEYTIDGMRIKLVNRQKEWIEFIIDGFHVKYP